MTIDMLFTLISIIIIISYPITLVLYSKNKLNLNKKQIYILSGILVLSLSYFSTKLIPGHSFDLSVYYRIYDRYQITHELGMEFSNNVILFKLILLLLCNLPSKEFIQFIIIFLTYTMIFICFYFLYYANKNRDNSKTMILSLIMQETLMSFAYIYSGGRNQIAFGLLALSLILYYFYRNKKTLLYSLVLGISSFLIHDSSIIIIGLFIISFIPVIKKKYYLVIGWELLIPIILFLFNNIELGVISPLIAKLSIYVDNAMNTLDLRVAVINTIVTFLLLFTIRNNPIKDNNLHIFLSIVLAFTLGAVIIPEIQRRMLYFISYFSPVFIDSIITIKNRKLRMSIYGMCFIIVVGLGLYHFVNLKANGILLNLF